MEEALVQLGKLPGRKVAVLGDMLELGVCTRAEHYRIGRIAAENAQILLAYGPNGNRIVIGGITGGMSPAKAMAFENDDKLLSTLEALLKPGDTVLFKGCRRMHMERLVERFLNIRREK